LSFLLRRRQRRTMTSLTAGRVSVVAAVKNTKKESLHFNLFHVNVIIQMNLRTSSMSFSTASR
jgi:archaellum component FlaG (FlaF/FlaG flagellin family)